MQKLWGEMGLEMFLGIARRPVGLEQCREEGQTIKSAMSPERTPQVTPASGDSSPVICSHERRTPGHFSQAVWVAAQKTM